MIKSIVSMAVSYSLQSKSHKNDMTSQVNYISKGCSHPDLGLAPGSPGWLQQFKTKVEL